LFTEQFNCVSCHPAAGPGLGPPLGGVFGSTVALADGRSVVADDNYLREAIMNPSAKIVRGYSSPSLMPTFQGTVSEEQIMQLIAYVKSLKPAGPGN
jgi:cytochrome c oxidase subunit 2